MAPCSEPSSQCGGRHEALTALNAVSRLKTYKHSMRNTAIRHLLRDARRRGEAIKPAYQYIEANYGVSQSYARKILATSPPAETAEDLIAAEQLDYGKKATFDFDFRYERVFRYRHGRGLFLYMQQFPTEESCLSEIDIQCPRCESYNATRLKRPRYWRCQECNHRFSTVPGIRLPLRKYLATEYLIKVSNGAITATAMAELVSIKRDTAARILRARKGAQKF